MQCSFGHGIIKMFYSNPQYNPTSFCIKEFITASKPTSNQKLRSKERYTTFLGNIMVERHRGSQRGT